MPGMIDGRRIVFIVLTFVMISMATAPSGARAQPLDPIQPFRAEREAYAQAFRVAGRQEKDRLARAAVGLAGLIDSSTGPTRARAWLELGTVQRLSGNLTASLAAFEQARLAAEAAGLADTVFEAWIGIARVHMQGGRNHGAAANAFERAVDAAGTQPSVKQRVDIAGYRATLELARGDIEPGVINAMRAVALSAEPKDRFFAELDLGDGMQKLAESCDYRPLIDARSTEDGADTYAACQRAVAAARLAYERAIQTASGLGWTYIANQIRGIHARLQMRAMLIDSRARGDRLKFGAIFAPRRVEDVNVSRDFEAGGSALTDTPVLATLIETVLGEASAGSGPTAARDAYMRGVVDDIRGNDPARAADRFRTAALVLEQERGSFFDPRRRGTMIENRGEVIRDLALRLLSLRQTDAAFAAFESVRVRGLGELTGALSRPDVTLADRAWLSRLLVLEARISAREHRIVARLVADGSLDARLPDLRELDALTAQRNQMLRDTTGARDRLSGASAEPASLVRVQEAVRTSGVPMLLYWTTYPSVVAWLVSPDGSDVRSVFLPAQVLQEKVSRIRTSAGDTKGRQAFDAVAARELYLFLIAPFAAQLDRPAIRQIMIVPQGPLISLPFEALEGPGNAPVIERWAISYAPNATMAVQALETQPRRVQRVAALVDTNLDDVTRETELIQTAGVSLTQVTRPALFSGTWKADSLHVLTHGRFEHDEALLSWLDPTRSGDPPILAAELLGLPLRGLPLAVLSACQGGQVGARISGELYGFSWALLAGGTAATVLSRWDVDGDSNGRWMRVFYREAAHGASATMAAATAMREMRRDGQTHPYYWAAMQVSGR